MSEVKGAIPKIIILAISILLVLPDPINIGVMIIETLAKAIQPFNIEEANQLAQTWIKGLKFIGVALFFVDLLLILNECKKGRFF